jgi:hypothetical protein
MNNGGTQARRPLMWALLTCGIAAVTAFIGYSIGASVGGGETGASEAPLAVAAPAFLPIAGIYASAREDGYQAARDRAYRLGRREGIGEGRRVLDRAGVPKLRPDGFYLVRVARGPSIAARAPVTPGRAYSLCRRATAVCERPAERRP